MRAPDPPRPLGVGLLGVGVVGSAVADALLKMRTRIPPRQAAVLVLRRALVRNLDKPRPVALPRAMLATDARAVIDADDVDIVVELVGGEEPAREYIDAALRAGKHVVTANKEVLCKHGDELLARAAKSRVRLLYEASVGGGIPIVGPLSSDLLGNRILSIRAIINGTTNYILTRMGAEGAGFEETLREAQALGYAEADPTSDVDGFDAAYKIAILARLAFRTSVPFQAIYREGIRALEAPEFRYARTLGYAVKLLAAAQRSDDGLLVRVHPALVPDNVPMAKVDGALNAVEVEGDLAGSLWFQGQGAGGRATASAVVGDLLRLARRPEDDAAGYAGGGGRLRLRAMDSHECQFYLRLVVLDQPGVLARVAGILGRLNISIASVIQVDADSERGVADIVITTHPARESNMQGALREIDGLDVVERCASLLRIESYPESA